LEFINGLIKPYLDFCRSDPSIAEELAQYPKKQTALIILDNHWSHTDIGTTGAFSKMDCDTAHLFPGSTDLFCALDIGVCKPLKSFFRTKFETYCASSIASQLSANVDPANISVNTKLSALKPLAGEWMISCYNHLHKTEGLVSGAWKGVADNLQKILPEKTALLLPIITSPTKCVNKFIESISPSARQKAKVRPSPGVHPQPLPTVLTIVDEDQSPDGETPHVLVNVLVNDNDHDDDNHGCDNNHNDHDNNPDDHINNPDDSDDPKSLIGRKVSVYWNDGDGQRWEQGVIKEMHSKVKFVIMYDFLVKAKEDDDSVDPDVIENLLGKKAVNWRYY